MRPCPLNLGSTSGGLVSSVLRLGLVSIPLLAGCGDGSTGPDGGPGVSPGELGGFGVLGDSNADEYRADDDRGGAYAATTLNWVELLQELRDIDFGGRGTRPEPRRSGFAFNWARSGAKSADLLARAQHTGLAAQIEAGDVSTVAIDIGINDFDADVYAEIYYGDLAGVELEAKIDGFVSNVTEALDTVIEAGAARIVLAMVGDRSLDPVIMEDFPDPERRERFSEAVESANVRLAALAADRGIATWDSNALVAELLSRVDAEGRVVVGGEPIDFLARGNEPHHGRLDDNSGHAGTVLQGLIANDFIVEALNDRYGLDLTPLSDEEIIAAAGIE